MPKLRFVDEIFIGNYTEDFLHGRHKSPVVAYLSASQDGEIRHRLIELELWRGLTWRQQDQIAGIFGGTISGQLPADLNSGDVRLDWLDDQVYLEVTMPVSEVLQCGQLEAQCVALDTLLAAIWKEVEILAAGVESPIVVRKRSTVFLCHSSRDKVFVRRLGKELQANHVQVWLDEDQVLVGHDFVAKMEEGIAAADFVAVVLSPAFINGGPWAKEEYRTALTKQVRAGRVVVLPILRQDCEIPALLNSKHYADFRKSFRTGFTSLLRAIRHHE